MTLCCFQLLNIVLLKLLMKRNVLILWFLYFFVTLLLLRPCFYSVSPSTPRAEHSWCIWHMAHWLSAVSTWWIVVCKSIFGLFGGEHGDLSAADKRAAGDWGLVSSAGELLLTDDLKRGCATPWRHLQLLSLLSVHLLHKSLSLRQANTFEVYSLW